jgi:hypothetical protein
MDPKLQYVLFGLALGCGVVSLLAAVAGVDLAHVVAGAAFVAFILPCGKIADLVIPEANDSPRV